MSFEGSVWVAFIIQCDPAYEGSCRHGEMAKFDFSGSSKGSVVLFELGIVNMTADTCL